MQLPSEEDAAPSSDGQTGTEAWKALGCALCSPGCAGAHGPAAAAIPLPFLGNGSGRAPWIPAQPGQAQLSSCWV